MVTFESAINIEVSTQIEIIGKLYELACLVVRNGDNSLVTYLKKEDGFYSTESKALFKEDIVENSDKVSILIFAQLEKQHGIFKKLDSCNAKKTH